MGFLGRLKVRALSAAGAVPLVLSAFGMSPGSITNAYAASQSTGHAVYIGTTIPQLGTPSSIQPSPHVRGQLVAGHPSSTEGPTRALPSPNGTPVSASGGGAIGFAGLNIVDQDNAGTGIYAGSQGSLEPPDQALCVGGGFVLEGVNLAFAVYSTAGKQLTAATAYNQFFMVAPESVNGGPPFGDFLSDPKCYFDPVGGRFVQTIVQVDPPGLFDGSDRTHVLVAISATADPTHAWNLFSFDTSDDGKGGTPFHPGCPCLPDQPLLGANADGIFISTNEFELVAPNFAVFNGAQMYAFSRRGLESGSATSTPTFVHIDVGQVATGDPKLPFWGSVQPSTSPTPGRGAEMLLSGGPEDRFQNNALVDNRIAVWALTGTNTLNSDQPSLQLSHRVLRSETYGSNVFDFGATQKSGPTPLRDLINRLFHETNPLSRLNANDSRMNQVTFANGKLFGAVNTVVTSRGQPDRVGIAYFVVEVQGDSQQNAQTLGENNAVSAQIAKQGYVAVNGENVLFGSIGVDSNGVGAMGFTLSGPDFFPSAAYVRFDEDGPNGPIHVTGAGVLPDDGFTAYQLFGGNGIGRWGDYSAAVAVGGAIWMAAEFIPGPNDFFANWGTFIAHVPVEE